MGDFYQNSHGQWFLCVTGKGEKTRLVPANSRFMVALQRYRRYLGLPDYPEPGETTAFIPSIDGERRITDRQIHNIIKQMIHNAVVELRTVNKHVAEELRHASAHWFRQTSNTTLVNAGVDRRFRKAHAGRSNNATAAIYEHIEQEDIYQAMEIVDVGLDGLVD
jgi:site-specific recombinase XerD